MGKVILIVEDDPGSRELIRDLLQKIGHRTLEATNGTQGVELAKAHKPDLILMDLQLPVMNGIDATAILKANLETQSIPVIALTAYAMSGDEERGLQVGCDAYITKPIRVRDFLKQVAAHLSKKKKHTKFSTRQAVEIGGP